MFGLRRGLSAVVLAVAVLPACGCRVDVVHKIRLPGCEQPAGQRPTDPNDPNAASDVPHDYPWR